MTRVLPDAGIITIQELAEWLGTDPNSLQEALSKNGIPVLRLSSRHRQKLVRLEDLRKKAVV